MPREDGNEWTELVALWGHKAKSGNVYYTGRIGGLNVCLFANSKGEIDGKQPMFRLIALTPQQRKNGDNG